MVSAEDLCTLEHRATRGARALPYLAAPSTLGAVKHPIPAPTVAWIARSPGAKVSTVCGLGSMHIHDSHTGAAATAPIQMASDQGGEATSDATSWKKF